MAEQFKIGDQVMCRPNSKDGHFDGVGTIVNDGIGGWAVYVFANQTLYTFRTDTDALYKHEPSFTLPEDAKWEAIGRGYASVLMEKQARIDRLERLIFMLYENIVRGVESTVLYDDDTETNLYRQIIDTIKNKHKTLCEACKAAEQATKKKKGLW